MLCAAEELVGVVISIGSPATGDGADVFMIGVGVGGVVMMGIVRAVRPSSGSRPGKLLGTCSVAAAIGSTMVQVISMIGDWIVKTPDKEAKEAWSERWAVGMKTGAGLGEKRSGRDRSNVTEAKASMEGMRSSGWMERRSRRRWFRLALILVPVPVPVPVPGDAAGCRRQDMGILPQQWDWQWRQQVSLARKCGGSVAAEADERGLALIS
ncbi:hypothetical protein NPX13_g6898 [Xylaria arbuscula]|uniref:Uncharacterized protein n=1 Tax=Xylaria arbuscula TaxID=114810 RepID=A0A9W8NC01_9PEZI|nr:hypothetical protein NPX13_g6898 [Xylaria arbuscula]